MQAQTSPFTKSVTSSRPALRVLRVSELMAEDRGWTRGHATCSFDDVPQEAPGYLAYGPLRLAALQEIDPGAGYPMHPHEEIETITILLSGSIEHEDSIGGRDVTGPDDVAVISAGTGMQHAEMTHGANKARVVLFWLRSDPTGQPPRFLRRTFARAARTNRLVPLASGRTDRSHDDDDGALDIRSDSVVLAAVLEAGAEVTHVIGGGRRGYLLATDSAVEVNGVRAEAGDRVLVESAGELRVRAVGATEIALLDLPA